MKLSFDITIIGLVTIVLVSYINVSGQVDETTRSKRSNNHFNQQQHQLQQYELQHIIRESYAEVAAFIVSNFNEKCKLTLHNCLFRTEWEKIFGKERLSTTTPTVGRKKRHRTDRSNTSAGSYYYCQPFLIGRFCIDDYLTRSFVDNVACLNGSDGNSPHQFRKSIYRDKCKLYYDHFFDSANSAPVSFVDNVYFFVLFANIYILFEYLI